MGTDTECDLVIRASRAAECAAIRRIRDELLADHLGADAEVVADAIAATGSVFAAVDRLGTGTHRLVPADDGRIDNPAASAAVSAVADHERPIAIGRANLLTPSHTGKT